MFFASNICCVSSGTVNARYCWEPRDVNGAKPFMKKCLHQGGNAIRSRYHPAFKQLVHKRNVPSSLPDGVLPNEIHSIYQIRNDFVSICKITLRSIMNRHGSSSIYGSNHGVT